MSQTENSEISTRWGNGWQLHYAGLFWPSLSRALNLLAVLNISLFFINPMVRSDASLFPILSLGAVGVASMLVLMPVGLQGRLWYYVLTLIVLLFAVCTFILGINQCLAL